MMADDLIDMASLLIGTSGIRPKQANLKRAVSTAYYALFHALSHNCVESLIGWGTRSDHYWELVSPVYRLNDHGHAKTAFKEIARDRSSSQALIQISSSFAELQEQRLLADYDPKPHFDMRSTRQLIERARDAIQEVRALSSEARRLLAVQLTTKPR